MPDTRAAMLSAFFKSLGQLGDRAILGALAWTIAFSVLIFGLTGWGLWQGLAWAMTRYGGPLSGYAEWTGVLAVIATIIAFWFWWRVVAIAVLQLFADRIVIAVERKHYPHAAERAVDLPLAPSLMMALRSLGRALLYNALALPFALVLLFTGVGAPMLFLAVNAVLVGRDLADMVAARHALPGTQAQSRTSRFVLGLIANLLLLVPLVNLFAPIIAAAMATHLFHQREAGGTAR
ncbi:EI24 domain-containing protein [Blastomonas sp.]|uniref:EI24 domain-containing protein n=1 Tax=Blastomonas sp. TaxID=1909299 RepID=UPI002603D8F8|nr:EI24 domain-containing protein [Blastomonas sp.]MDM7957173.1 EI24 domain-containing protein [Blastomonas sp.]